MDLTDRALNLPMNISRFPWLDLRRAIIFLFLQPLPCIAYGSVWSFRHLEWKICEEEQSRTVTELVA